MPIRMQNPVYPFEMRRARITGEVLVEFTVDIDGKVKDARAISSPHPELSKAAIEAMYRSEYRPGTKAGKPAAVRMRVPIKFDL
jgi:protein TonB